jgi:hypothetical protein
LPSWLQFPSHTQVVIRSTQFRKTATGRICSTCDIEYKYYLINRIAQVDHARPAHESCVLPSWLRLSSLTKVVIHKTPFRKQPQVEHARPAHFLHVYLSGPVIHRLSPVQFMPYWLHEPVIFSPVQFWQDLEKQWTGCGFGFSDFGLKTELNRTLKH